MRPERPIHLSILCLCLLSCLLSTRISYAQDAKSNEPTVHSRQSSTAEKEAAERFRRGLSLFNESEYALALIELERAYQLAPNFRALYNIGLVNIQLGRYANATHSLERYLQDGTAEVAKARREEVQGLLNDLKLRTATLTLLSKGVGIEVVFDGKVLGATPFREPLLIDAGEHTLRASAIGFAPKTYTFSLAGQDEETIHVVLDPLPRTEPLRIATPTRTVFWPGFVAAGVLSAGAVASGIIMLDARSDLESLKDKPGSGGQARSDTAQRANVAAMSTDVLTGLALVTTGVSVYLSLRKVRSQRERDRSPDIAISPRGMGATVHF